jgi:hypothetical protein
MLPAVDGIRASFLSQIGVPTMAKASRPKQRSKRATSSKTSRRAVRNSRTTVSGPAMSDSSGAGDVQVDKTNAVEDVASAFAFTPDKAAEYDADTALAPRQGASAKPSDPIAGASTVSELNASEKVGSGGRTSATTRSPDHSIASAWTRAAVS